MTEIFIDYVMYYPTGGIYVPMGTFEWQVNASVKLSDEKDANGVRPWVFTKNTAGITAEFSPDH
jgi:hypothetical protein